MSTKVPKQDTGYINYCKIFKREGLNTEKSKQDKTVRIYDNSEKHRWIWYRLYGINNSGLQSLDLGSLILHQAQKDQETNPLEETYSKAACSHCKEE
jgi:hypothetical protein